MLDATTAAEQLRANRMSLGISQTRLARLSSVSWFKICMYELGDGSLNSEERSPIREALQAEAERLRNISIEIEFGHPQSRPAQEAGCD